MAWRRKFGFWGNDDNNFTKRFLLNAHVDIMSVEKKKIVIHSWSIVI